MSTVDAVAGVMFATVILYAVFAGADFGSGVWDLTAGNRKKGAATRTLVDHSIGPVWEANHVWLIFIFVFLWTGFPGPFAALMRNLSIPFWLAGLGIVARGAGFAFRKYAPTLGWARSSGIVFALASLTTPFFLGSIAGAVASGRVPADGSATPWDTFLAPTPLLGGILAIATCTFLAGVLLAAEAKGLDQPELAEELRKKSILGAALTGLIGLIGIPVLLNDAETLVDGLLGRGLPLVLASIAAGTWTLWLLVKGRLRLARAGAAVAVATIVAGWGAAQYPWILVDEVTLSEGAGAPATLLGLLVASGIAAVMVVPPLIYLFTLADRNQVGG